MANRKISDLTALTAPATGDLLPIVDISEAAAADKNKKITYGELLASAPDGSAAAPSFSFDSDPNSGIYSPGADQLAVATNGVQRLTVDTAATTSTLPVVHPLGAVGTPSITFTSDLNTGFWSPTADTLAASTAGTERLRITSAGLVGVGTSSPAETLDVNGNLVFGASFAGRIRTKNAGGGSAAGTIEISAPNETTTRGVSFGNNYYITASNTYAQTATNLGGSAVEFRANNANYGEILFRQKQDPDLGGAERTPLVIDSSGRVGIGTTSPSSLLHLADAGNITVGTTTGTKIGTATTQKLGFYNATPVVQPAAVANATTAIDVITQLNDLLAKLRTLGIIAT